MNRPVLAVLDIAGTTVDEGGAVYRVLADTVAAAGRPATDADIRRWMGADKREALAALTGRDDVGELHAEFVRRLAEAYAATPPRPLAGVPDALAALRVAGCSVVLTTGFDRQVTDPLLAGLDAAFTRELDAVVCAVDVGVGRPDPAMIHRAMTLTGTDDPAGVLVAGDTVLDVAAGRNASAGWVVGVLTGAQTREELAAAAPTHVLDGVADIPALFG